MAKTARTDMVWLSDDERELLRAVAEVNGANVLSYDGPWVQVCMLLDLDAGASIPEVAELYGCSYGRVYAAVRRWDQRGLMGLRGVPGPPPGRERGRARASRSDAVRVALTGEERELIESIVERHERDLERNPGGPWAPARAILDLADGLSIREVVARRQMPYHRVYAAARRWKRDRDVNLLRGVRGRKVTSRSSDRGPQAPRASRAAIRGSDRDR